MILRFTVALLAVAALLVPTSILAADAADISFKRTQLDTKFRSEGVAVGDFNSDGRMDISAGSVYYAAPDWKMVSVLEKPKEFDPHAIVTRFATSPTTSTATAARI